MCGQLKEHHNGWKPGNYAGKLIFAEGAQTHKKCDLCSVGRKEVVLASASVTEDINYHCKKNEGNYSEKS